jgi:hypothetical protein
MSVPSKEDAMLKKVLVIAALLPTTAIAIAGSEFGSPNDAKAMLSRAVAAMKTDKLAAIDQFNHNDPAFRDRDLFVFCFNGDDGRYTAHEAMVTHDIRRVRDSTGHPVGDVMYRAAVEDAVVEITYASPLPGSTSTARKRAFITRVGDQICGVSAYELDTRTASAR